MDLSLVPLDHQVEEVVLSSLGEVVFRMVEAVPWVVVLSILGVVASFQEDLGSAAYLEEEDAYLVVLEGLVDLVVLVDQEARVGLEDLVGHLAFFVADLACLDAAVENLEAPYDDRQVPWVDQVVSALGVDGMASVLVVLVLRGHLVGQNVAFPWVVQVEVALVLGPYYLVGVQVVVAHSEELMMVALMMELFAWPALVEGEVALMMLVVRGQEAAMGAEEHLQTTDVVYLLATVDSVEPVISLRQIHVFLLWIPF